MKRTVLALLALVPVACSSGEAASPQGSAPAAVPAADVMVDVMVIDAAKGSELIDLLGPELTIIDVRSPTEFAEGHLAGAANADVEGGQFGAFIAPLDRDAPYLVYCRSGRRSAIAAQAMADAGFTRVYDMGAITGWVDAGFPVET